MNFKFLKVYFISQFLVFTYNSYAGGKRMGILVFDGVLTSDITAPLEVFGFATKQEWFNDYELITINVGRNNVITTEEGVKIQVDDFLSVSPQVDILLVPSAYDMTSLLKNKELVNYISNTAENAEWIASNCSGSLLLAEAGLLAGKRATTWAGGEGEFAKAYPDVLVQENQNYVIDGNVITSNGSVVSYQSALVLLEQITSKKRAAEVGEALQINRVFK